MNNLSSGIGRAADHFSQLTSMVAIVLIILGILVFALSFRFLIREYAHLMVIYVVFAIVASVLFMQHEVGHYGQGIVLLFLSVMCGIRLRKIYLTDKKNRD